MANSISNPIYLGVTIWGRNYCEVFINFTLASLLADGNIPALHNPKQQNKFLFCTTDNDWEWLKLQPLFSELKKYMQVEFLPLPNIAEEEYNQLQNPLCSHKLYIMSQGHLQIVSRMHQDQVIGGMVLADSIYANNSLRAAYSYIEADKIAVLVYCPRFSRLALLSDIQQTIATPLGMPLTLTARDLVQLAIKNIHTEVLMQQWDKPYLANWLSALCWDLPDKSGFVFYTWCCWYAFINYSKLTEHDASSLLNNTIDGTYLCDNLQPQDVYFITDSDEFTLITFSTEELDRPLMPISIGRILPFKQIKNLLKIAFVKNIFLNTNFRQTDPFKISFTSQPIFIHSEDLTADCFLSTKPQQIIIDKILSKKLSGFEVFLLKINRIISIILSKFMLR